MPIEVNSNHHKVIEISFWMLDQMLCRFEQWAMKHEAHSVLYEELNPLSDKQCAHMKDEIKAIRILLKQLKDELGLHQHIEPIDKLIHASSLLFVTDNLMSIQGKGMDAYGKTTDELIAYLDPKVTELIKRLGNIAKISMGV